MSKELKKFPKPLPLITIIGPSFIILAFGLGSGELILWPYLTSNYGLGLIWAALLGISFQYFINMEIERYALVKGESVFVGLSRYLRFVPQWFIFSTFLGFGLPGIIAASAQSLAAAFGSSHFKLLAIILLIFVGLILSTGKTVYTLMEKITKTVILIGVPFILLLAILVINREILSALFHGFIGLGDGYRFVPPGISILTFLAAFAYSGAGGNLNLAQSIYIKEKGYGMGAYAHKIGGLFTRGKLNQSFELSGEKFALTESNIDHFKGWWKRINAEHAIVFWFLGFLSMALLMVLSYATTYHANNNTQGIHFVIEQSRHIALLIGPWAGPALLFIIGALLMQTQLGILDSASRIMSENYALKLMERSRKKEVVLSKIYYSFIWLQIVFGIILISLNVYEPRSLIVAGAVVNAWAMIIHIALVHYLNRKSLPKVFQPKLWRKIVMAIIFIFFLGFGALSLWINFGGTI